MTTIHDVDREYRGYREYRPVSEAAGPKSVVKALALIIGAVVVVGAGVAAGVAFLSTPLPAHPTVVGATSTPSAVVASAVAAPATRSSVIINIGIRRHDETARPKPIDPPGTPTR
jgi:hypothetical protein